MSVLRIEKIRNGDYLQDFVIFQCDSCGKEIQECWPHSSQNNKNYCVECSFRLGIIDSDEYLDAGILNSSMFKAAINPKTNNIEIAYRRGKFTWELTNKDLRHTPQYKEWREKVFKRDSYTCQYCEQKGGQLNAHHIKFWSKYPSLRFDVKNGITLCEKCHRKVHARKR